MQFRVAAVGIKCGLKSGWLKPRILGMLTAEELAQILMVSTDKVDRSRQKNLSALISKQLNL